MLLTFLFCELIFAGYVFAMRLSKADSRIMKDSELVYSGGGGGGGPQTEACWPRRQDVLFHREKQSSV